MVDTGSGKDSLSTATDRDLSPADSLALIDTQHDETLRRLRVDPVPIVGAWGLAWLAGFGAVYLASSDGPGPYLPAWAASVLLVVLFSGAIVLSVGEGVRGGRGVEGPSRRVGAMYGWSWALALAGLFAVNRGLAHQGLPADLRPLVWSGTSLLVVGLLYLATGIVWRDPVQYGLGAWTLLVGAGSVSAGVPANFAVLSLAGGGGFLVAAVLLHARRRPSRRAHEAR